MSILHRAHRVAGDSELGRQLFLRHPARDPRALEWVERSSRRPGIEERAHVELRVDREGWGPEHTQNADLIAVHPWERATQCAEAQDAFPAMPLLPKRFDRRLASVETVRPKGHVPLVAGASPWSDHGEVRFTLGPSPFWAGLGLAW